MILSMFCFYHPKIQRYPEILYEPKSIKTYSNYVTYTELLGVENEQKFLYIFSIGVEN